MPSIFKRNRLAPVTAGATIVEQFAKPTHRVLAVVPDMDVLKRDLAFAGTDYGNQEIGFADLHALRMSLNRMVASQGVKSRSRQAHLRHTDPRLTEVTYFDKSLFVQPLAEELKKVMPLPMTAASGGAGNAQEIGGSTGHSGSPAATDGDAPGGGSEGSAGATEMPFQLGMALPTRAP